MGTTTTLQLTKFIPNYWDTVLGENLYPNLFFYQFGTKRVVPRNFGTSIKIPRIKKQNIIATVPTEGTAVVTCPISGETISGTLAQFAGAYRHSDVLIMTALSDIVGLTIREISRDIARRMDRTIRNSISGIGDVICALLAGTTYATVAANAAVLTARGVIEAVTRLDADDNPRPPDNHYPAIIHPVVQYDLLSNLSAGQSGAWVDVIKYTEGNVNRAYVGEIGRLYGARFVTSSNIKRKFLSTGSATSGVRNYFLAPDSYYVTEINDMTARTYVKGLGSAGAADPANQFATVAAKVFFGVVPNNYVAAETRIVRVVLKTTLAGGDTTT